MTTLTRYFVVSLGGLASDALFVFIAHSVGFSLSVSILIGYFFATMITYLTNEKWTFQQDKPSLKKAATYLTIVTLGGFLRLPFAHLALLLIDAKTVAWIFSVGLSFIFNYLALKWYYRKFGTEKPCPKDL